MFELQTITKSGKIYLKRWRILGYLSPDDNYKGKPIKSILPFTVRIHQFHSADDDGAMHNHPWRWAFSIVLWGWYFENRFNIKTGNKSSKIVRLFNFLTEFDYHSVDAIGKRKPITLFITGPRCASWGFLKDGWHVPWKTYLGIE